jgi:2,3-bisphosphoglycerate-dependent phosphoglycerate mutase
MVQRVILVKHAMPVIEEQSAPRDWELGALGRLQSQELSKSLATFDVVTIYSSREPKARQTAEIIARGLDRKRILADGLEEFDRPVLPMVSQDEHARLNRPIFDHPSRKVLGRESANAAFARFDSAVQKIVAEERRNNGTIVVVSHGTVISLFVSRYNPIDGFDFWRNLSCPSYVELALPDFKLLNTVFRVPNA